MLPIPPPPPPPLGRPDGQLDVETALALEMALARPCCSHPGCGSSGSSLTPTLRHAQVNPWTEQAENSPGFRRSARQGPADSAYTNK